MAGAIALVPSVECSTCKSAPSVRSYDCHLSEKYAVVLIAFGTPRPILDQASDVCRRSNMLRKLSCIAGSSYSSAVLNEIIP